MKDLRHKVKFWRDPSWADFSVTRELMSFSGNMKAFPRRSVKEKKIKNRKNMRRALMDEDI